LNKDNKLDTSNLSAIIALYTKDGYCNDLFNTVYNAVMLARTIGLPGVTLLSGGFGRMLEMLVKMSEAMGGGTKPDKSKLH